MARLPATETALAPVARRVRSLTAGVLLLAVLTVACHPLGLHVDSVHSVNDAETSCVHVTGYPLPVYPFDEIRDRIVFTMLDPLKDGLEWDSLPKVQFTFHTDDCDSLDASARASYEIEFRVLDAAEFVQACPSIPVACADPDPSTAQTHGDHTNYGKFIINLNLLTVIADESGEPYCSSFCKHTINHETGHALGLHDPFNHNETGFYGHEYCSLIYEGIPTWNISVMHTEGYCSDVEPGAQDIAWPSVYDIEWAEFVGDQ